LGILGKALWGAAKGSLFFVQHGGYETFQAGMNKLGTAINQTVEAKLNESSQSEDEDLNQN